MDFKTEEARKYFEDSIADMDREAERLGQEIDKAARRDHLELCFALANFRLSQRQSALRNAVELDSYVENINHQKKLGVAAVMGAMTRGEG